MNKPTSKKPFELQTNVCIHLDEFDLSAPKGGVAKGVVLAPAWMQGETVGVRLMDADECISAPFRANKTPAANKKFLSTRPTIAKFAEGYNVGKNEIPAMTTGGIIMFHGCTRDRDASTNELPVWKAQYMENYGNEAGRSVLHGVARVAQREYQGVVRANLDLLSPEGAQMIGSLDDLSKFYADFMEGHNTQVGVPELHATKQPIALMRILTEQGASSRLLYTQHVKKEVQDAQGKPLTISIPGNALDSMDAAFVRGEQGNGFFLMVGAALDDAIMERCPDELKAMAQELRQQLLDDTARIEVLPGMRIPIVGKSLEELTDEGSQLHKVAQKCVVRTTDDNGNVKESLGFVKMTVGLMLGRSKIPGEAPNVIVTKFTEDEFAKARSVNYISTPNFSPQFTQAREYEAAKRAEQAASMGGVEVTGFEQQTEQIARANLEAEKPVEYNPAPAP